MGKEFRLDLVLSKPVCLSLKNYRQPWPKAMRWGTHFQQSRETNKCSNVCRSPPHVVPRVFWPPAWCGGGETASLCHRFPPQPCVPWGFSWRMLSPLCVRVLSAQTPHLQKPGQSGYPGLQAAGAPPESRLRDRGCGAGAWSLVASQLEHSCLR